MNQYLNIAFEVEKTDVNGSFRTYKLLVPYRCPTEEALSALDEIRAYLVSTLDPVNSQDQSSTDTIKTDESGSAL